MVSFTYLCTAVVDILVIVVRHNVILASITTSTGVETVKSMT